MYLPLEKGVFVVQLQVLWEAFAPLFEGGFEFCDLSVAD